MKPKKLTLTVHIQPREQGPLTVDERQQLADFFAAIIELRPKEDIQKGNIYDPSK